jgi:hypothetical protein
MREIPSAAFAQSAREEGRQLCGSAAFRGQRGLKLHLISEAARRTDETLNISNTKFEQNLYMEPIKPLEPVTGRQRQKYCIQSNPEDQTIHLHYKTASPEFDQSVTRGAGDN